MSMKIDRTPAASALLSKVAAAMDRGAYADVVAMTASLASDAADDLDLLGARYASQAELGDIRAAIETLRRLVGLRPDLIGPVNDLALFLFMSGSRAEAESAARHALRLAPADPQAHNLMGMYFSEANELVAGEAHYRRAMELAPAPLAKLWANLALNLMQQGRMSESEAAFKTAAEMESGNPATLVGWARLCEAKGDTAAAHALLDRAEPLARGVGGDLSLARALVLSREKKHEDALRVLNESRRVGDGVLQPVKQLERGRLYDRLDRYDEAWTDFEEANARFASDFSFVYDKENVERFFRRLRFFFSAAHMALLPRATVRAGSKTPIFILGFPRSGTTMIEQVLSRHSQVAAGGELSFIGELVRLAPRLLASPFEFPESLSELWIADRAFAISTFRDYYLARAEQAGLTDGPQIYFTDKQPLNETFLPFLHLMFPHAKFVHVVRHPLDVAVSVMANYLTHGFNCGFKLETFAHHYRAVHDLVAHYRGQTNIACHTLRYEAFVHDQQGETERLLAFLGLPFEEACINFHDSARYANTASYAQVTEKLYDRSVGRWRHYRAHLAPAAAALGDVIAALGYDV